MARVIEAQEAKSTVLVPRTVLAVTLIVVLGVVAHELTVFGRKALGRELIEYPIWAVAVGLAANGVLGVAGAREKLRAGFRTELFLKTGLVLLGATINFGDVLQFGSRGLLQAGLLVTSVFLFTWWLCGVFGLDQKLKALMSTAISICGVSAAIAAAGSVLAKKEQLGYVTTLVVAFALPLMLIQPYLANLLGLPPNVAGAWIGGNIDTTAAVVGAGAIHSEQAMKVASIVKISQNALIGLVAFLLALYWVLVVERKPNEKPSVREIWNRFPKFVVGFVVASIVTSIGMNLGLIQPEYIKALTGLRNWFLTFAFVSIGLDVSVGGLFSHGGKPVAVYSLATLFNTGLALGIAWLVFGL